MKDELEKLVRRYNAKRHSSAKGDAFGELVTSLQNYCEREKKQAMLRQRAFDERLINRRIVAEMESLKAKQVKVHQKNNTWAVPLHLVDDRISELQTTSEAE